MQTSESASGYRAVEHLLSGQGKAIPLFKVFMPPSVMESLRNVLMSGYVGEGPRVQEFERRLAPWFGTPGVLALNSGTSAIELALRLAEVGPGDEVISTPVTCVATNEPILAAGGRVVWADIDPGTGNIDPEDVARKINERTRAILCVHWGGYPCDLDELNAVARSHGLSLIEDACHAFGSTYRERPIGCHSDFACFSFQAVKLVNTVDGGALTCRAEDHSALGRLLRWYGIDRQRRTGAHHIEEDILHAGHKLHMNDVTATIGIEQLEYAGENLRRHQANAARYNEAFTGLKTVRLREYRGDRTSSHWLYTLRVSNRPAFMAAMEQAGITVSPVHGRNDHFTIFEESRAELPGVDEFTREHVSIPVGWWLTEDQVEHIISTVRAFDEAESSGLR